MICPNCGKEMIAGALGPGEKGALFWASEDFFKSRICNFITIKNALNNGAIRIWIGNGVTNHRTRAWACKDCNYVLVDCNR